MPEIKVNLGWRTNGFKEQDLPKLVWKGLIEEFLRLREQYVSYTNGPEGYDLLNSDFDRMYPAITDVGCNNVDAYVYSSYIAWRLNDAIRAKMKKDPEFMKSEILEPFIFMDGNVPDLGVHIKGTTDWTFDLLLKPVGEG